MHLSCRSAAPTEHSPRRGDSGAMVEASACSDDRSPSEGLNHRSRSGVALSQDINIQHEVKKPLSSKSGSITEMLTKYSTVLFDSPAKSFAHVSVCTRLGLDPGIGWKTEEGRVLFFAYVVVETIDLAFLQPRDGAIDMPGFSQSRLRFTRLIYQLLVVNLCDATPSRICHAFWNTPVNQILRIRQA